MREGLNMREVVSTNSATLLGLVKLIGRLSGVLGAVNRDAGPAAPGS